MSRLFVGSSSKSASGLPNKRLRQKHAQLAPAGQVAHALLMVALGHAQTGKQLARVGLGAVAVLFRDDALELTQTLAVFGAELGFGQKRGLLFQHRPEPRVAHDHDVEHAPGLVGKLILLQHAGPLRTLHGAAVGLDLARKDLEKGRFAGAVRPGDAVAAPGAEVDPHLLKEPLLAVGLGDVLELDRCHGGRALADCRARGRQKAQNGGNFPVKPRISSLRSGFPRGKLLPWLLPGSDAALHDRRARCRCARRGPQGRGCAATEGPEPDPARIQPSYGRKHGS